MDVTILGCGPAGLMAAHAATLEGHEVSIVSERIKSELGGAQYLHQAIEGITEPDPTLVVRYLKFGDAETYAHKVYGYPEAGSSWEKQSNGWQDAWDLRNAYDRLWGIYEDRIEDVHVDPLVIESIKADSDLVISSIPARALCLNGLHNFGSQGIYLTRESLAPNNTIVYSGRWSELWTRTSTINGECWTEYSKAFVRRDRDLKHLTTEQITTGRKPTGNDCNCNPEIVRVGRFGQWRRGVLTHHAFQDALKVCRISEQVK